MTYCHEKLPVIPSLRRSRSDRCLLGPEPIGGIWFVLRDVAVFDEDDVRLPNNDSAVGLPDDEAVVAGVVECVCGCIDGSSLTESNDDSSGKNVFIAEPLPPLRLQLAADVGADTEPGINLLMYFLRGESLNEPCFGEQSRDILFLLWYMY